MNALLSRSASTGKQASTRKGKPYNLSQTSAVAPLKTVESAYRRQQVLGVEHICVCYFTDNEVLN